MFRATRILTAIPLIIVAGIGFDGAVWAFGGGSMDKPSTSMSQNKQLDAGEKAVMVYDAGVSLIKEADEAVTDAAKAIEPRKQQKAQDRARKYFTKAQAKFENAVELNPEMFQAWNYVGYSKRNLGDYSGALEAYDRALKLNPEYLEAIEYRGHAYLGLNRLDDAKRAYLDLFASNRTLASKLLVAMQSWISSHRNDAQGMDGATIEDFAKWVGERGNIASSTAGLAPTTSAETWH